MNEKSFKLAGGIVGTAYATQAVDGRRRREALIRVLLEQGKWPEEGWDDATIEFLMTELATMDSNNFLGNAGLGEREARIACGIVARRHFRLGHGVGRSGDIAAIQPKAAGSSVLARVAERMVLDLIRMAGARRAKACIILPLATGMSIVMTLLVLKARKPSARYVLWHRIDQKTCFKAIVTAGLVPVVIEGNFFESAAATATVPESGYSSSSNSGRSDDRGGGNGSSDELCTNMASLKAEIERLGAENVLCVITTTSCFAPRAADRVPEVAALCKSTNLFHVVNNAYGIQSSKCMHLIDEGIRVGNVTAFVQSTDKNLMVPVGGAIVASPDKSFVAELSKLYPGRASASPVIDVFLTLLSLGRTGYRALLAQRKAVYAHLKMQLSTLASAHGERLLDTPGNPISMAMTLGTFVEGLKAHGQSVTYIGSMLFSRGISGARVVAPGVEKEICGFTFTGYGSHTNAYPKPYITAAAAIGMTIQEVDICIQRLDRALQEVRKRYGVIKVPTMTPAPPAPPPAAADTGATGATVAVEEKGEEEEEGRKKVEGGREGRS